MQDQWWNETDPLKLVNAHAGRLVEAGWDPWVAMGFAPRLWEKVTRVLDGGGACWDWSSATYKDDRAIISKPKERGVLIVSRHILEVTDRKPEEHEKACHTCDRPICVRPEHLWWGSGQDNVTDMIMKGRMKGPAARNAEKKNCDSGHPLSGENLGVNNRGQRFCRECARSARRRSYKTLGR